MQVPMLDLARGYAAIREEVLEALAQVCDSQHYILGEQVTAFEREFAQLCGTEHAVACASGTDALWLGLAAGGIKSGDSVLTTPFSFFATASSIVRAGARPVFVDIEPETLNLDPHKIRQCLQGASPRPQAMMPVHLYGQCANMDALNGLAADFNLTVIEDAAQAVGAAWKGKTAGSLGEAAAFSFYPTKNLSAFGDAGILTTNNSELAERARSLRNHGSKRRYYHDEIGANSRLDSIQAAVLRVKMKRLPLWNKLRAERARTYDQLLQRAGLTGKKVHLLKTDPEALHIFHQYVIRVPQRDELRSFLKERGVSTEVYYPVPLHLQKCFAYLGYAEGDLPEAEKAAKEVLALPMFPELETEEQKYVVDGIAEFFS
jgi:dTDP-4-amino-4,6-dideoxygalactose transaminase